MMSSAPDPLPYLERLVPGRAARDGGRLPRLGGGRVPLQSAVAGTELTEQILADGFILSVLQQFRLDVDDDDGHPAFVALWCDRPHGHAGVPVDLLHGVAFLDETLPVLVELALRHEQDAHGWLV